MRNTETTNIEKLANYLSLNVCFDEIFINSNDTYEYFLEILYNYKKYELNNKVKKKTSKS